MLATRNVDDDDEWYLLPGGGQHQGENLQDTLQRECREEIGATVQIGDLRMVREYIGKNHEYAETDGGTHQVEFMFDLRSRRELRAPKWTYHRHVSNRG